MTPDFRQVLTSTFLATVLGFATLTSSANEHDGSGTSSNVKSAGLKSGEPFTKARSRLVKSGWEPIRRHRSDRYEYLGTEKELAGRGFMEVESCSVDAGSLCIFYYRRASSCLRVDTRGERIDYMKVTRWTNECPESP